MGLYKFDYYKTTNIAAVFGTVASLFGIIWLCIFLSFLTLDPKTIDLFSVKYRPLIARNVTVILEINAAKALLSTSLAVHFLWFQASVMLALGNKRGIVAALWIWIILGLLILLTDTAGTIFSIIVLFVIISEMNIVLQSALFYIKMFVCYSKFGFIFHIILVLLLYSTRKRIKELNTFQNQKQPLGEQIPSLPISTIQSIMKDNNVLSDRRDIQLQDNNTSSRQVNTTYITTIDNYNESAHSHAYSMASTATYCEIGTDSMQKTNQYLGTSTSATIEHTPQSTSSSLETNTV